MLLVALHDEDIAVAQAAARALLSSDVSDERLLECFDDGLDALWADASAPPPLTGRAGAACWALVTVARRSLPSGTVTEPVTVARVPEVHARLEPLAELGVPLPGIPRDVREAILRAQLPGERTTDPRFLLEGLRLGRCEHDAEPQHPARAHAALTAAGLRVGEPRPIR